MAEKLPAQAPHLGADRFDVHQAVGGTAAWRGPAEDFYSRVDHDPVLRPFFPGKTHRCAVEEMTAFLTQLFGGPSVDTQYRWWLSLRESHLRFEIGQAERAAWMKNMVQALEATQIAGLCAAPYASFSSSRPRMWSTAGKQLRSPRIPVSLRATPSGGRLPVAGEHSANSTRPFPPFTAKRRSARSPWRRARSCERGSSVTARSWPA